MTVYQSRYKHRNVSLKELVAELGMDEGKFDKFVKMVELLFQFFIGIGGRGVIVQISPGQGNYRNQGYKGNQYIQGTQGT